MARLERDVVLAALVSELRKHRSWCGQTHVQKAMYFLHEMAGVPTGFDDFILYKHGPYSFELRNEITAMRADLLLELKVQKAGYGPSLKVTRNGRRWCRRHSQTSEQVAPAVEFVAARFGERKVRELERLGTALYVVRKHPDETDESRLVALIVKLKPHIDPAEAREAVETVIEWEAEVEKLGLRAA